MIFTSDHKVRSGLQPDDKDGRTIRDDEFDTFGSGIWRLEGNVLVTEIDNKPYIEMIERLDPSNHPVFKKDIKRQKIVKIDGDKMVFDNGYWFDRVRR